MLFFFFFFVVARTLIEADSDYWVMQKLDADLAKAQEDLIGVVQWTDLQDQLLGQLHSRGVTRQDLEKTLEAIPFVSLMNERRDLLLTMTS